MAFKRAAREEAPEGEAQYFQLRRYKNQVLAFEVLEFDETYENRFDEIRPAVRANVTVVTGPDKGTVWEREWVEAEYVVKKLKDEAGDTVIGKLVKPGKAFFLNEPDDDEYDAAVDLLAGGEGLHAPASAPADDDEPPF